MTETQPRRAGGHILERIVRDKRSEVARLRPGAQSVRARALDAPPPRDFRGALAGADEVAVIAEVKRRSPGAGDISPGLDPVEWAQGYAKGGAAAISVLTDAAYFGGSLDDLARVRDGVAVPVLRKDFTIDEVQVWEARAGGADAVLLIARILDPGLLTGLREAAEDLGMAALVEVHDEPELDAALASGASLIGVNNRDLSRFTTDLDVTTRLADRVPEEATLVSESGVRVREDVRRLGAAGADAVLVGEALLRRGDPVAGVEELVGCASAPRG